MIISFNHLGGGGGSYTLPVASEETLGGIKVGENLSIDTNGVLSADGGSTEEIELAVAAAFSDTRLHYDAVLNNKYMEKKDIVNALSQKAPLTAFGDYYKKTDVDALLAAIYALIEDKELATSAAINDLNGRFETINDELEAI